MKNKVNKDIKKLSKKAEKSVTQGSNYTVLANSEFEVLFGATNRNHEVQFRLLFTPLAQRELLEIMKDKEIGYGDDFDFVKHKKINRVYPEHLHKFEFDVMPPYYWGYDIDSIKEKFLVYTTDYFKGFISHSHQSLRYHFINTRYHKNISIKTYTSLMYHFMNMNAWSIT